MNGIIANALRSLGIPTVLEPPGLLRGDGKRPDGSTLVPWSGGRPLLWDFTCPDTFAPSHLRLTSNSAGAAASAAEVHKVAKYSSFIHTHIFVPVGVESSGVWEVQAAEFLRDVGRRLSMASGDSRSGFFFRQRVDVAIQRGNALSVLGTFPPSCTELEASID